MKKSSHNTLLGAIGAMVVAAMTTLPDDAPIYVGYLLGIINIGFVVYLGTTHPGKK